MIVTVAEKILAFNKSQQITAALPAGVEVMNPYQNETTFAICQQFYRKYYHDTQERTMIMGINPGRFGGGITGVPFTDPIKLETYCGIPNDLVKKPELSADFIYRMIMAYGGPEVFYSRFYISAVSPLGFMKDGKNLNYYDLKPLQQALLPYIVQSLEQQLAWGLNTRVCYCLGEGQNFKFLVKLNKAYQFFDEVVPLSHPRFIMQYRRKTIDTFVQDYLTKFDRGVS